MQGDYNLQREISNDIATNILAHELTRNQNLQQQEYRKLECFDVSKNSWCFHETVFYWLPKFALRSFR